MTIAHKTMDEVCAEVKKLFDLDVELFFAVSPGSGSVGNGKHQFIACDYRKLSGYTVAWAIEVRQNFLPNDQVYRVNIMR